MSRTTAPALLLFKSRLAQTRDSGCGATPASSFTAGASACTPCYTGSYSGTTGAMPGRAGEQICCICIMRRMHMKHACLQHDVFQGLWCVYAHESVCLHVRDDFCQVCARVKAWVCARARPCHFRWVTVLKHLR